jgi:hypothetical protein
MEKVVVHEDPKITVWCYPLKRLIHHQMHGPCYYEPFRAALEAGREAMVYYKCDRWLSDDRENGPLPPDDELWATLTWFPRTRDAGWKYWAMVMPVKVIGQLNVSRFVKLYREQGVIARLFTEIDEAFDWLDQPAPQP